MHFDPSSAQHAGNRKLRRYSDWHVYLQHPLKKFMRSKPSTGERLACWQLAAVCRLVAVADILGLGQPMFNILAFLVLKGSVAAPHRIYKAIFSSCMEETVI
jgi:hypothetical protein